MRKRVYVALVVCVVAQIALGQAAQEAEQAPDEPMTLLTAGSADQISDNVSISTITP